MEKNYPGSDRRKAPRGKAAVVEYSYEGKSLQKILCFPRNISTRGISIITNEEANQGTIFELTIYLPIYSLPIQAKAKVVWVKDSIFKSPTRKHYDSGLVFTEIDEADRQKIATYTSAIIS